MRHCAIEVLSITHITVWLMIANIVYLLLLMSLSMSCRCWCFPLWIHEHHIKLFKLINTRLRLLLLLIVGVMMHVWEVMGWFGLSIEGCSVRVLRWDLVVKIQIIIVVVVVISWGHSLLLRLQLNSRVRAQHLVITWLKQMWINFISVITASINDLPTKLLRVVVLEVLQRIVWEIRW